MLFFSARCECFGNAASSQRKEFPKRPSSVLQTFHRNGSIPRICRMADMMIIDATKKSLSNRQACIVIPLLVVSPMMLGKVARTRYMKMALPSTLRTTCDLIQLSLSRPISPSILVHSHGSMITYQPESMTQNEHRSAAKPPTSWDADYKSQPIPYVPSPFTILRRGINDLGYVRVTLVVRINLDTIRRTDRVCHNISCFLRLHLCGDAL